jgi:ribose transport system substrate-binding protein
MRKLWCGLLVGLVLPWSSALAAEGKAGGGGEIVIGVSLPLMGFPVYDELRKGIQAEADVLGVKLDLSFAQFLAANQIEDIGRFVEDHDSGIIVSPVPRGAIGSDVDLGPTIDAAVGAGVPVAIASGWAETDKALVRVNGDAARGGRMAAEVVLGRLGAKGAVVVLDGPRGAGFNAPFKAAFEERLTGSGVRVVASEPAGVGPEDGRRVMADLLRKHLEFDAVLGLNDGLVLGALQAMSDAGVDPGTKVIVGCDAIPDVLQLVKLGNVTATVDNSPREQGRRVLRYLVEYIRERKAPPSKDVRLEPKLITKEPQG